MLNMILLFIGATELIVIAVIVLLLFGGKKIPELMRGLGRGVKEFKDGTISLGTDRLPSKAQTVMFGHTVTTAAGGDTVTYKSSDNAEYVGVGFVIDEVLDGSKTYTATIIYKCKFAEAADSYTTKGDSIEFKTPTIEGAIAALSDYTWKTVKTFASAEGAEQFIQTTLGYTS